jgi:hypothetical protein
MSKPRPVRAQNPNPTVLAAPTWPSAAGNVLPASCLRLRTEAPSPSGRGRKSGSSGPDIGLWKIGALEHQPSPYSLSWNALPASLPLPGFPLARSSRQKPTPRSTKEGSPYRRSSSWTSARCSASVKPTPLSAATLRASASVSEFLMWRARPARLVWIVYPYTPSVVRC